jgi:HEPN domain-containing protein
VTLVDEWAEKAEADYLAAVDLNRRRKHPLPDLVCYHCQQSVEKYLKAYLVFQGASPPLTHDLVQLLNRCILYDARLSRWLLLTHLLNPYGVMIRYPGMTATLPQAQQSVKAARSLRRALRKKLGLS